MQNQPIMPQQQPVYQQPVYQQPVYQQPVKSFTNQAVIAFFLYWAFWIPGLAASLIWWFEANGIFRRTNIRPDGYTALLIEVIFGLLPIVFIVLIIAWFVFAAILAGLTGAH